MHRIARRGTRSPQSQRRKWQACAARPMTTEMLAQYILERASKTLPLQRVRLHERADFFAEYRRQRRASPRNADAVQRGASAAKLRIFAGAKRGDVREVQQPARPWPSLCERSDDRGPLDERSGTLYNFTDFQAGDAARRSRTGTIGTSTWKRRSFATVPPPAKTSCRSLWQKLNPFLENRLVSVCGFGRRPTTASPCANNPARINVRKSGGK